MLSTNLELILEPVVPAALLPILHPKFAQHLPFPFDSNAAKILIYNGCARN